MAQFVQGDSGSTISITCTDQNGNPINLTGASAVLAFYVDNESSGVIGASSHAVMTITNAPEGIVQYTFSATDLANAGTLYYRVAITLPGGNVISSAPIQEIVIEPII